MPPPELVSIVVTPDPAACTDETQVQLTATGHYDDSSTADITDDCGWRSLDETVAVMGGGSRRGLVTGLNPGTATIEAQYPPFMIAEG